MRWLPVLISGIAACMLFMGERPVFMWLAILVTVGCLLSCGAMRQLNNADASELSRYRGGFHDFSDQDLDGVPEWLQWVNLGFSFAGLLLLVAAGILWFLQ